MEGEWTNNDLRVDVNGDDGRDDESVVVVVVVVDDDNGTMACMRDTVVYRVRESHRFV